MRRIILFFDKLEDVVRRALSHTPIWYGFLGGIGVVLFWRGVWHTADYLHLLAANWDFRNETIDLAVFGPWWDGPLSFAAGSALLLLSGLFVSNFIGNEILISGLRHEKKLTEKTEKELQEEFASIKGIARRLTVLEERLTEIKKLLENRR